MRLLLVEDDAMVGEAMARTLKSAEYAVDWVKDGEQAQSALKMGSYDICVLDLGLPKKSGLKVLEDLRQDNGRLAVVIVTARDSVEDKVAGLDLGADDYIVKPFDSDELKARLRSVLRRKNGQASPLLTNGKITLNPSNKEVRGPDGKECRLTGREYALLHALILRPGNIMSKRELEETLYGWDEEPESNVIEFVIHSIRKKLGSDAIKNIRGLGWMVPKED